MTREIRFCLFLPGGGQNVAAWRHPDTSADGATSFVVHLQLAREAERGLTDPYFPTDRLAVSFGVG